jgi:hypothetical protein
MVIAVLQKDGLDARVMLQNSNEFRSTVSAVSDDTDLGGQLTDYSSL